MPKIATTAEPQTYPYDVRVWRGKEKILRETVPFQRSLLTQIPLTRGWLQEFCDSRGLPMPTTALHLRADRVRWSVDAEGGAILVEIIPLPESPA